MLSYIPIQAKVWPSYVNCQHEVNTFVLSFTLSRCH